MRKLTWRRGQPLGHKPMSAAERMRRMRERRKAAGLKPVLTWAPRHEPRNRPSLELRLLQARSLVLHVMSARKIMAQPELLEVAHRNLARWRERGSATPGAAIRAWRSVLRRTWPETSALMTEQSERGIRLRSTTPFFGVLTPRECKRVYDAFRAVRSPYR